MIDFEWLTNGIPITPPAGVDDPRPVLATTHAALIRSLQVLSGTITAMADISAKSPWADGLLDDFDRIAGQQIETASTALATFRATRDCKGQG